MFKITDKTKKREKEWKNKVKGINNNSEEKKKKQQYKGNNNSNNFLSQQVCVGQFNGYWTKIEHLLTNTMK